MSPTALKANGFELSGRMSDMGKAKPVGSPLLVLLNGVVQGGSGSLIEEIFCLPI